jgi:DNA-binding CsgD family transcriptional regulator
MAVSRKRYAEWAKRGSASKDRDGLLFCESEWSGIAKRLDLSHRQLDIARCILQGQGDRQIAQTIGVSINTVQTHMKRLHEKLDIQSRVELVTRVFAAYNLERDKGQSTT